MGELRHGDVTASGAKPWCEPCGPGRLSSQTGRSGLGVPEKPHGSEAGPLSLPQDKGISCFSAERPQRQLQPRESGTCCVLGAAGLRTSRSGPRLNRAARWRGGPVVTSMADEKTEEPQGQETS